MTTSRSVKHLIIGFGALLLAMLAVCTVTAKFRQGARS